ncbi:MAG: hypothetical protein ABL962_21065 [Fimbriimonadaceae bacterium]
MNHFTLHHMDGNEDSNRPLSCLELLYIELFSSSYPDGTVAVSNDDLALFIEACRTDKKIILIDATNLLTGKHMNNVPKERVIELWKLLIEGKTDEIFAQPWKDWYT